MSQYETFTESATPVQEKQNILPICKSISKNFVKITIQIDLHLKWL